MHACVRVHVRARARVYTDKDNDKDNDDDNDQWDFLSGIEDMESRILLHLVSKKKNGEDEKRRKFPAKMIFHFSLENSS